MTAERQLSPIEPSDADTGVWQGQTVARQFVAPDGMVVLVGRTAHDNDILTFKLASQNDFWLHVAGATGSHVVVRNPQGLHRLPRDTLRFAAALAAGYSKARRGGQVTVHVTYVREVKKPRGFPAGKVALSRYESVRITPSRDGSV
jgi:predicted ribosome quality control (RQC) complex YloA/Tae2 family protein